MFQAKTFAHFLLEDGVNGLFVSGRSCQEHMFSQLSGKPLGLHPQMLPLCPVIGTGPPVGSDGKFENA